MLNAADNELLTRTGPGTAMRGKISIKAYPTREFGELVWGYMGPMRGPNEYLPELPQ